MTNPSPLSIALRLGRVSNLPTVWSNVLAGLALNGGGLQPFTLLVLAAAGSLFYVAGMCLNDAYDRVWDARHRPERPIPAGEITATTVLTAGYGLMAAGIALVGVSLERRGPLLVALLLCGLIVLYNKRHKGNPFAPVLMGLCRVCLYLMGALSTSAYLSPAVFVGAAALLGYLVLLTSLAKKETVLPGVGPAVGVLIAGISLLDAILLLVFFHPVAALVASTGFFFTRALQRKIAGT